MDSFLHRLVTWSPAEIFMAVASVVIIGGVSAYARDVLSTLHQIADTLDRLERSIERLRNSN